MVHLIPKNRDIKEFHGSSGEMRLYNDFKKLSDKWYIFHSIKWSRMVYRSDLNRDSFKQSESDFVIFNPDYGLLTLEVKSGGFVIEDNRLKQFRRDTNEVVSCKSPMDQADSSKFMFRSKLTDHFTNFEDRYPVHSMVWLTDVSSKDIQGKFPHDYHIRQNTFLHEDLENVEETLIKCFEFYKVLPLKKDNKIIAKTINLIAPEVNAIPALHTEIEDENYFIDRMTTEQGYLLDYLEEQKIAAIQGGAGTGKTVLAVEKARRLSQNQKVVYLCFNRMLVEYLKKKYNDELPNVDFTNLYSLTAKALKKDKVEKQDILYFLKHLEDYPHIWNYDSVIIDEGQDFSNDEITELKEFQEMSNEEGSFYIFYDKNQLVQQRNNLEWLQNMDCRLILSINCRNTQCVAETALSPLGINSVKTKMPIKGEIPLMNISDDENDSIEWINKKIRELTDNGIKKDQITILSVKGEGQSIYSNRTKIGNYSISSEKESGKILFTTARKFKGLESDFILLVDVDAETFRDEEQKRLFYVGASRARNRLFITSVVCEEEEKQMVRAITNGRYEKRMRLASYLKITLR